MIPELVSFITRQEGRKFLQLDSTFDGSIFSGDRVKQKECPSLYVHIPFCRSLCPFCCFNRYLFREDIARRYFQDLKKELDMYLERGFAFSSVYFGGGTPTILMDELENFITYLRSRLLIKEISLETTPRELSPENVSRLQELVINRLSVGVQSFQEPVLKTMGRSNGTYEEVEDRLLMVEGKFDTVNVDFVFNFPGQTVEQFEADVAVFKTLGLDQATFYPLMPSPHKKESMERKFNRVDNSREKLFYDVIIRELYHSSYTPSTAWCFSRGDRMIDEYIIEYDDYIGIGSGSVSMWQGNFLVNSFSLERYHYFINSGRLPIVGWRKLSLRENLRYYLLTKLFGLKFDKGAFKSRFGTNAAGNLALEMAFFRMSGIVAGSDVLRVTEKGMYPVSVMMRDFFASLNTLRESYIEQQI